MEGVATDGIPGHIDPTATHLPNRVDPVGSLTMVDDVLHAEAANERSLLLASNDRDRHRTCGKGELDARRPGAAGRTGDQHGLAGLKLRPVVETEPRCAVIDRDRRRLRRR